MSTRSADAARAAERGSALISSVVVLVLIGLIGIVLLHSTRTDVRASLADLRSKKAFYLAEAGLQTARDELRQSNAASVHKWSLDDELQQAAGPNGTIDFDLDALRVTYNAAGRPTGLTGFGDDVPLRPFTTLGEGFYAAFLGNDAVDGTGALHDTNSRALLTGVGGGRDRSFEAVQSIVSFPMPAFPATVTLLGPSPSFQGGNSSSKSYGGDDCQGASGYAGEPGQYVPVVGVIGASSKTAAEGGVLKPNTYAAGPYVGNDTVRDIDGVADPRWTDCQEVLALAGLVRDIAEYRCTASSPCTHWGSTTMSTITHVEGDGAIPTGKGLLLVTGRMTASGADSWDGVVLVIGKGEVEYSGGGNGHNYGGLVVANIAGPDRLLFTSDDCSASPDGFASASYVANGGGNKDTVFCADAIGQAVAGFPPREIGFRQR